MAVQQNIYDTTRVVILGGGISGVGAALLAHQMNYDVFLSSRDKLNSAFAKALHTKNITHETGAHTLDKILNATLIVKSPGIPENVDIIKAVIGAGIPIISEIEFASVHTNETIIAITGSNGKTTVTSQIGHLLEAAGLDYTMGGNIGKSFAHQVVEGTATHRLLEVSSFQLDGIKTFKPHIAVLLNITPDHLDRYDNSFEAYRDSKMRIALNQDAQDFLIYNQDDLAIKQGLSKHNIKSQLIPFSLDEQLKYGTSIFKNQLKVAIDKTTFLMPTEQLSLKGQHNTANAMAAATTAKLLKIRKETIRQSLQSFQGVEHRLEQVLKINKVQYINDSKATNVNATFYALDSMEQPTIWIVGGVDKGNDYSQLYGLVNKHVKAIVCLGTDNTPVVEAFSNCVQQMVETTSMEDAVRVAYKLADAGDNVLLSPACASFDLFENYEDRGRQFKNAVRGL
jgi:UDP-N-acetylmuramoylalanine--D-glutamate ligase